MELKKNKTNKTTLDVTCENRHDVLRQKKLLIGCGGGFQECSQSYSPVARWITEVALTLTDESQQFGNIEETSVIARTPRTRARKMCHILPLRHEGINWCCDSNGQPHAGHCWHGTINMHLRGSSLEDCPGDDRFLSLLDLTDVPGGTMAQRRYPPAALIECVADIAQRHHKSSPPTSGHC